MRFTKMNGAGNDFILINNMVEGLDHSVFPALARTLCHRRLSIGADGLMVVERPGEAQTVETPSGIVTGRRIDRTNYRIRLTDPSVVRLHCPVEAQGRTWECAYVELGVPGLPHAAVAYPGLAERSMEDLRELGKALRWHSAFPKGANVNFYDITGPDRLVELTYERGVEDFTFACGTGTGATVTALTLLGKVSGEDVAVSVPGGLLRVTVERTGEAVKDLCLTGPTNTVCEGEVLDEALTALLH